MAVDEEIDNVRKTVHDIQDLLYRIDAQLETALNNVDQIIADVESQLQSVVDNVANVRHTVHTTADYFPFYWTYMLIMMVALLTMLALGIYLIIYVIDGYRNREVAVQKILDKYHRQVRLGRSGRYPFAAEFVRLRYTDKPVGMEGVSLLAPEEDEEQPQSIAYRDEFPPPYGANEQSFNEKLAVFDETNSFSHVSSTHTSPTRRSTS